MQDLFVSARWFIGASLLIFFSAVLWTPPNFPVDSEPTRPSGPFVPALLLIQAIACVGAAILPVRLRIRVWVVVVLVAITIVLQVVYLFID